MTEESESERNDLIELMTAAAQAAAEYLKAANNKDLKKNLEVPFPRGFIRTLASERTRFPDLSTARARTVACTLQLCDVNRFFMGTFQLSLTAGAMWEWHITLPVIAVIETLCYEVVQKEGWAGSDVKFKKCIDILHSKGIFKHPFQEKLHDLREYRNDVHLYLRGKVKMADGGPVQYNNAVKLLQGVEKLLKKHYRTS